MTRRLLACVILAATAVLSGCGGEREANGAIIVGIANSPVNLDPRMAADEYSQKAHQLIFDTLMKIDDRLRVVPSVAESLEQPNGDPLTYVARLRRGITFHNGRELTADDVVYTFGSFLDPKFGGRSGAYRMVASVNALDPYTVEFKLKEPAASFPINLVMGIVQSGSGAANVRTPIGTGPYQVKEFLPDDRLVLEPFAGHWQGAPANAGVVMKVVPDDTMRGLELRKGTVDLVVNDVAPDIVWQFEEEGRLKIARAPGTDYAYLGMNLKHAVLSNRDVRRAIGHAIDRDAIVKHLRRGLASIADGLIPPMSWAHTADVFQPHHDPAKAKQLLDAAGFRDPDGEGPLTRFTLVLRTSTSEIYRLQAAAIQHDLGRVGIALDVRSTETQTLFADLNGGNFQLYTAVFVGITDPDMLRRVFHSGQKPPTGLNRVFYTDRDVDRLIEAGARTPDEAARQRVYAEAQRIIAESSPYIPLWTRTNVAVSQPDLEGITLSPIADFMFLKGVRRRAVTP
jgi:peptide/nickel transport system substrate-binding protein